MKLGQQSGWKSNSFIESPKCRAAHSSNFHHFDAHVCYTQSGSLFPVLIGSLRYYKILIFYTLYHLAVVCLRVVSCVRVGFQIMRWRFTLAVDYRVPRYEDRYED
jgi:hypothetical protein